MQDLDAIFMWQKEVFHLDQFDRKVWKGFPFNV